MKEKAIQKINTMGKVGAILALIAKILISILLALCVIGVVVVLCLPANLCKVKMDGSANVVVDLSAFGVNLDEADSQKIKDGVEKNANISYAGNKFSVDKIEVGGSTLNIAAAANLTEFNIKDCVWALVGAILNLVLLLISTIFASRLAKAFRSCQSPFEGNVIVRMKQFAYSLIPWAVISSVVNMFESRLWMASREFHLNIDFGIVITVLLILALAYIFQYGAVLQQESDETL